MSNLHWRTFADERFDLRFSYPEIGLNGLPVQVYEIDIPNMLWVKIASQSSREINFEVHRWQEVTAIQEVYEKTKSDVETRLAGHVTALMETTFAGFVAFEYSIRLPDSAHTFMMIQKENFIYVIIYDPTSDMNLKIRDTVVFL